MAKLTLSDITNLEGNPLSAQTTINNNSALIETALENTLSRDGTSPNQMEANLDMNSNRILNLIDATTAKEPVTLDQLNGVISAGLPLQTGNAGRVLMSDGSAAQWADEIFIDDTNNRVGIGTAEPTTRLQIGDATVSTENKITLGRRVTSAEANLPVIHHDSILSAGTTSDIKIAGTSTSGGVVLAAANVNKMYVAPTGVVVGTMASPVVSDGTLHVHTASAGTVTANGNGDDLIIENSGQTGMSLLCPDVNVSSFYFGTPSDNLGAYHAWDYTNSLFSIGSHKASANVRIMSGNNTEAIRINSLQNIGIGTTSPDGRLHVYTGTSGAGFESDVDADEIIAESSGNVGMTLACPNTSIGAIYFADPDDPDVAGFEYNHLTNYFSIKVNTLQGLDIDSTRHVGIGTLGGTINGQLDVVQLSATGAIPTVRMYQNDNDQEFMRFKGAAAAATLTRCIVNEGDVTTATRQGWVKVYIEDDGNQVTDQAYYMPVYTLA